MGRVVIRTVWLGLLLLVCLIGLASFKLAIGSPRPMAVVQASAAAAGREMPQVGTGPAPVTLTKSDRLPVTYISSVEPLATELRMTPEPPSIAVPKIISRHWARPQRSQDCARRDQKAEFEGSSETCAARRTEADAAGLQTGWE